MSLGTNDLSQAMEVAGAALVTYGNDINDMISLVTAGTEIMVGRSTQVARGLNTIAGRITKNEAALKAYGIEIYNVDGSLRSTYSILADLAPKWEAMSDAERVALGETLAGTNQYKVLASVLGNFDSALKAHTIAEEATGSSIRENQRYMESLEAHLNNLKSAWQALANDVISSDFIKALLDAGTAVLKFADSDIGRLTLKIVALGVAFKAISSLRGGMLFVDMAFGVAKLGVTLAPIAPELTAIALAIGGIIALIKIVKNNTTFEGLSKQAEKLSDKIEDNKTKMSELKSEYDELQSKGLDNLTEAEKDRLRTLEYQLANLKEQNEEIEKQRQAKLEEAHEAFRGEKREVVTGTEIVQGVGIGTEVVETKEDVKDYIYTLNEWTDATLDARTELDKYAEDLRNFQENGSELDDEEQKWLDTYSKLTDAYIQNSSDVSTTAQEFSNLADSEGSVADTTRQVLNSLAEENSQMISNWNSMQDLVAAETQLRNGQKLSETQIQQLIAKYPALRSQIDAMRNGELAAANAIHAVGVQSLGTSKTVIANSKAEADAAVKSAEQVVASERAKYLAYVKTLDAAKDSSAHAQAERDRAASDFSAALAQLREAKAAQAMYSQAVYYGTEVTAGNTSATSSNTSATEKNTNAIRESTQALKDQTDAIKNAADYMVDKIDEQIDTLEDSKDAINKYYDDWIERLQDTNSELEDQIELENALRKLAEAKSKKVRVYRDGGFAYVSDTQAVAEAQREASTLQRQKEQEDLIAQLEKAREKDLASVDKQIDAWEKEKQTWEDASKSYDNYLATQALGIDQEGKNWSKRLGQAKTYTSDYLKLMQAIQDVESGKKTPAQGQQVVTSVSSDIRNLPTSTSALKSQINTSSPISAYTPVENVIRTDTSGNTVINVANITLPNVENPTEFIADLQDFARYASQSAGNR